MPNFCDYKLKVKGNKDNCKKFLDKMNSYDEDNHFWRIFEANIEDEGEDFLEISGYCAWSIESCCRARGYSNGVDLFAVNTKDLDLELEVWGSENEGMFFQEYYLYKKGECLKDECVSIDKIAPDFWDKDEYPTFEEFANENNIDTTKVTEDCYDGNGEWLGDYSELILDGFDNWGEFSI